MNIFTPSYLEETQSWIFNRLEEKISFQICGDRSRFMTGNCRNTFTNNSDYLSLKNLNALRFFDPEDMVVGVEAGMNIIKLQEILAEYNMVLPINPWFDNSTVGSVVACNDFGPNRMNMGGLRDYIIGIEYINGKGEIVHAGGKVVKNVSGYDITRMMLGSQGGLGAITAVNFKIMPKPLEASGMFEVFDSELWLSKVAELHTKRIPLDWVQAVSTSDSNWLLGIGYSGNEARRSRIEIEIRKIFGHNIRVLVDGESFPGQIFTPGKKRFSGFLSEITSAWKMPSSHFNVCASAATQDILNFPYERFRKENYKMIVHPIGGDIYFLKNSCENEKQLNHLAEIKSAFINSDSKLRLVWANEEISIHDLGKYGVSYSYSLIQRLKNHLDPSGLFFCSYYDLDTE